LSLSLPDHDPQHIDKIHELTAMLNGLRGQHTVNGSWILKVAPERSYEDMISTIDAAQAAEFDKFTIAGDAHS